MKNLNYDMKGLKWVHILRYNGIFTVCPFKAFFYCVYKEREMDKKSFVLYRDQCEIFKELNDEDAGKLIKAICFNDSNPAKLIKLLVHPFLISLKRDEEKSRCGKYHWNWKGGVSDEAHAIRTSAEYKEWCLNVFSRDDYTCQICNKRGGTTMHAHHIKSFVGYPALRLDIDNGVTLCSQCHTEKYRGLRNV